MASNALRDGFREVLRDPALLLIEIGWRWTFGASAIFVGVVSFVILLGSISVDPQKLRSLGPLNPFDLAQTVAATLTSLGFRLLQVAIIAGLFLAVCWIVLSAFGRYATLSRPALVPGASLSSCFAVSTARALLALGALLAWIMTGLFTGLVAAATAREGVPNLWLIVAILLPALVVIVGGWSWLNWYLSLAPLFPDDHWSRSVASGWRFSRDRRDALLEVSIVTATIRAALFVAALMLSIAVSAVITNPRVLIADLIAISLLYFLVADFFYVARLAAYAGLREIAVAADGEPTAVASVSCLDSETV